MTASEILRPKEDKKDVKGLTQDLIRVHLPGDKKAWLGEFCVFWIPTTLTKPQLTNHLFFQSLTLNLNKWMVSKFGIVPIPPFFRCHVKFWDGIFLVLVRSDGLPPAACPL